MVFGCLTFGKKNLLKHFKFWKLNGVACIDMIGELPDALLLKILSLLPAKDVVATMVLSKRWQHLWMMVPKLVYDDSCQNIEYGRFSRFVDRSLFLHEAPVIETLHFKLGQICGTRDIRVWIIIAAYKCCVRELIIEIDTSSSSSSRAPVTLPRSLYSGGCRRFVTLKLSNATLVDDSSTFSFPSLKKLSLKSMKYPGNEFVNRLLSNCLVLEDLVVERFQDDNVTVFTVRVPNLKNLILYKSANTNNNKANGFVIDTPSLECLDIVDYTVGFCVSESYMPKIVKANVDAYYSDPGKILGSITRVKQLYLCLATSKFAYPVNTTFGCLVHLYMSTWDIHWFTQLKNVLRVSPNLRSLKLEKGHRFRFEERLCWIEQESVPECLLSSLETVEWIKYSGTEEEKRVASFILRSGSCLKKVTIITHECTDSDKKLEMLTELSLTFRRSPTCKLVFK